MPDNEVYRDDWEIAPAPIVEVEGGGGGVADAADCPSCGQRMALVGAEWWHERPYVEGLHPRDCEKRIKLLEEPAEVYLDDFDRNPPRVVPMVPYDGRNSQ